jgi:hypothetical protein
MSTITDVFEFAAQNADYWTDLLSSGDYPSELTGEETRALEAARAHIETLIVELLHAAGMRLAERLGAGQLAKPRFKAASTEKNRSVALPPPTGLENYLYRIEFGLYRGEDGVSIKLYAGLVVKKGALDGLRASLTALNVDHAVDNYYLYSPGIELRKGVSLDALAEEAAGRAARLLEGCAKMTAPPEA